jgi:hypothetical protein
MKIINKIVFLALLIPFNSMAAPASKIQEHPRLTGFDFVAQYMAPQTHNFMAGYAVGLIDGFGRGLSYNKLKLDCHIPSNLDVDDTANSISISIAANRHLQKENIDTAILEGFALSFCKKAGIQT